MIFYRQRRAPSMGDIGDFFKKAVQIATLPITAGEYIAKATATPIVGTVDTVLSSAAHIVGGAGTVLGAAGTAVHQTVTALKPPPAPPPPPSKLPLIIGGVGALGLLAVVLLTRKRHA